MATVALSSCSGQEEYDAYVADLKAQPAVIDTISSPTSYAAYLDSLAVCANAFDQLGLKLNDTQKDEISTLSMLIQEALVAKYDKLAAQTDSISDNTVLDASAPVQPFGQADDEVKLN